MEISETGEEQETPTKQQKEEVGKEEEELNQDVLDAETKEGEDECNASEAGTDDQNADSMEEGIWGADCVFDVVCDRNIFLHVRSKTLRKMKG